MHSTAVSPANQPGPVSKRGGGIRPRPVAVSVPCAKHEHPLALPGERTVRALDAPGQGASDRRLGNPSAEPAVHLLRNLFSRHRRSDIAENRLDPRCNGIARLMARNDVSATPASSLCLAPQLHDASRQFKRVLCIPHVCSVERPDGLQERVQLFHVTTLAPSTTPRKGYVAAGRVPDDAPRSERQGRAASPSVRRTLGGDRRSESARDGTDRSPSLPAR